MRTLYSIRSAFIGLRTNKVRSMLTILGVVIGITAIILIVSIGKGAEDLILGEIKGLGADTIVVRPGTEPTGPTDLGNTLFADSLKNRDVEALKKKTNVPELVDIAPVVIVPGTVSYGGETDQSTVFGWKADFFAKMMDVYPERGAYFTDEDIRQKASVAVIGVNVKEELFGFEDALGKYIKIRDRNFRVVAVLPEKGSSPFFDVDNLVVIPYTTAQTYLLGVDYYFEIMVKVTSPDVVQRSVRDIELTLRELHNITNPEKDDFFVVTQQGAIENFGQILNVLTLFLSSVVAISLVVGGIGVMNIMLVSVTERTREIGLRKALGATDRDIMSQFLVESMILTVTGGIVGITLGVILSVIVSYGLGSYLETEWKFSFPVSASLLGVGVSALVGLAFGLYPARKASKKSPIEALRYE